MRAVINVFLRGRTSTVVIAPGRLVTGDDDYAVALVCGILSLYPGARGLAASTIAATHVVEHLRDLGCAANLAETAST